MDAKNQFVCFLLSILVGFAGGLLYEIFAFFRLIFGCEKGKRKAVGVGLDIAFGLAFAVWSVYASFLLRFPSFRVYMGIGWLVGGIIYSKTLRRMVAFFEKVCYNVIARMVKRLKVKKKLSKKEGE